MLRGSPERILRLAFLFMCTGWVISSHLVWDTAPVWAMIAAKAYFALFVTVRNGLFLGFFYIALGAVIGLRSDS